MYYILINGDNNMYATQVQRIMQRSKLVDDLYFVVEPMYNGHDMSKASVLLEYLSPASKRYRTEFLVLSEEMYGGTHLQYKLPVDTSITEEAGKVEMQVTFAYTDLDLNGNGIQRVRKAGPMQITVVPIAAWSDIIPDSALSALDQRLIKLDAQMKGLNDYAETLRNESVDDIVFDKTDDTIHLSANGNVVGSKLSIKEMLDDGIPVVDLGSADAPDNDTPSDKPGCEFDDEIVEFGPADNTTEETPVEPDDGIIEF